MSHGYQLGELVEWVMANRRGKAFHGWTMAEVTLGLADSLEEGALLYSIGSNGEIDGVVHGKMFEEGKVLYILNILTVKKGVFRVFVKRFTELFPGVSLEAERRHRLKKYNTTKLVTKVINHHRHTI